MGEKFNSFIKSLSDHEFAVYLKYQGDGLFPHAQKDVKEEIKIRHLTKVQLENFENTPLSCNEEGEYCERCGSNKVYDEKDIEYNNGNHFTREIEVSSPRCRLCNYNPTREEKNLFQKIKRFFLGDPNQSRRVLKTHDWFGE